MQDAADIIIWLMIIIIGGGLSLIIIVTIGGLGILGMAVFKHSDANDTQSETEETK